MNDKITEMLQKLRVSSYSRLKDLPPRKVIAEIGDGKEFIITQIGLCPSNKSRCLHCRKTLTKSDIISVVLVSRVMKFGTTDIKKYLCKDCSLSLCNRTISAINKVKKIYGAK